MHHCVGRDCVVEELVIVEQWVRHDGVHRGVPARVPDIDPVCDRVPGLRASDIGPLVDADHRVQYLDRHVGLGVLVVPLRVPRLHIRLVLQRILVVGSCDRPRIEVLM